MSSIQITTDGLRVIGVQVHGSEKQLFDWEQVPEGVRLYWTDGTTTMLLWSS